MESWEYFYIGSHFGIALPLCIFFLYKVKNRSHSNKFFGLLYSKHFPKVLSQIGFYYLNFLYYLFYDVKNNGAPSLLGLKADCLSWMYQSDKYGIVIIYLACQIILHASYYIYFYGEIRNYKHYAEDQKTIIQFCPACHGDNVYAGYSFLRLRFLKVIAVASIFFFNTDKSRAQATIHFICVIVLGSTDFLYRHKNLTRHRERLPTTPVKKSRSSGLYETIKATALPKLQPVVQIFADLDNFFPIIWGVLFIGAQQAVEKHASELYWVNNVSWTLETLLMSATLN